MKLRTDVEIQEYLDNEFAWRLREIDLLKTVVRRATSGNRRTLIRASIPLFYAHWEGFVKAGAEALLCFVSLSGKTYRELAPCFAVHGLTSEISGLVESKKEHLRVTAMEFVMSKMDERASFGWRGRVSSGGNLNYERFQSIAAAVGIDITRYETRRNFVNESLVKRRNEIAHGALGDLTLKGFTDVANEVLVLLRWFKTDLENSIALKAYLATHE